MRELYENLRNTEYGQTLESNVRWGTFKPEWMTSGAWERLLGPDVNNYRHMKFMAGLTDEYLSEAEQSNFGFTEEDADLLKATAWVHDFAEAIDGDIPDPLKEHTVQAYEAERKSLITVLGSVTESPEEVADLVIPVMQGRSELSVHWRCIEQLGYLKTTDRAGVQADRMNDVQQEFNLTFTQAQELQSQLVKMNLQTGTLIRKELEQFNWIPMVRALQ